MPLLPFACWLNNHGDMIFLMATLQINLPENIKAAAQTRAAAAGYASVDQYIASLIEADELAPLSGEMEAELIKGLASGPAVEITHEFLADLKKRARANRENAA
jgi:hypothetical protein